MGPAITIPFSAAAGADEERAVPCCPAICLRLQTLLSTRQCQTEHMNNTIVDWFNEELVSPAPVNDTILLQRCWQLAYHQAHEAANCTSSAVTAESSTNRLPVARERRTKGFLAVSLCWFGRLKHPMRLGGCAPSGLRLDRPFYWC